MASSKFILVSEVNAGIQVITLNRPKQGNAFKTVMYGMIADALSQAAGDTRVKAVVLTGNGRFFSTGADVSEVAEGVMEEGGPEQLFKNVKANPIRLTDALVDFPKLCVAALNGPVVGWPAAAMGLMDLVYCAENSSLTTPFLHLGIAPEAGSSVALARTVGHQKFMDWLVTSRVVPPSELVEVGLAKKILPSGSSFLPAVLEDLQLQLKNTPLSSIVAAKVLLRAPVKESIKSNNQLEFKALVKQFESGVPFKKFAEKQKSIKKSKL